VKSPLELLSDDSDDVVNLASDYDAAPAEAGPGPSSINHQESTKAGQISRIRKGITAGANKRKVLQSTDEDDGDMSDPNDKKGKGTAQKRPRKGAADKQAHREGLANGTSTQEFPKQEKGIESLLKPIAQVRATSLQQQHIEMMLWMSWAVSRMTC
jgi:hypothetical protein